VEQGVKEGLNVDVSQYILGKNLPTMPPIPTLIIQTAPTTFQNTPEWLYSIFIA
jgi:hypothetical protein